jgi:hypothetical protein
MEKVLKLIFSQNSSQSTRATKKQLPANCVQASTQTKKYLRVSCASHLAKASFDHKTNQNKTKRTLSVERERAPHRCSLLLLQW